MADPVGKSPATPRGTDATSRSDDTPAPRSVPIPKPRPSSTQQTASRDRVDQRTRRDEPQRTISNPPIPVPRPRARPQQTPAKARRTAVPVPSPRPRPRPSDLLNGRFVPAAADTPDATTLPTTAAGAPITSSFTLAPMTAPNLGVDVGRVVGGIASGRVDVHLEASRSGKLGPVEIPDGLRVDGAAALTNGTLSAGNVRFSDARNRDVVLPVLGPLLGVSRMVIDNQKLLAQTKLFGRGGLNFVRVNATSNVFEGHSTIPIDAQEMVRSLGLTHEVPLTGPDAAMPQAASDALDIFKLDDAVIRANAELASTNGRMVSFGDGVALSIKPGSRVRLERANGRNTYDLQVNVDRARFGKEGGASVETGPASLHVLAEETVVNGKSRWAVRLLSASAIQDVRVSVPLTNGRGANHFELGNIEARSGGQRPIVALDGNQLQVNVDGRLERMQGDLALRDPKGRTATLELGANGAPTTVRARFEMTTDITGRTPTQHLRLSGDTQGLRVAVRSPNGIQLAGGEGFSLGVADGTQLSGGGHFTYEQNADGLANFSVDSPQGISADVVLHDTNIARSLGQVGIRANLVDGSRMTAQVRKLDWASGAVDVGLSVNAKIDQSRVVLASGENALIKDANATADIDIRSSGTNSQPTVRGVLRVDTASGPGGAASGTSTGIEFLPDSVAGFDQGVGGVRMRVDEGKVTATLPFTLDAQGFRSSNGDLQHALLEGTGLDVVTEFDSDKVARGEVVLPELAPEGALSAALARHDARVSAIEHATIPMLTPLAAAGVTTAGEIRSLATPALVGAALQDIDLEVTTNTGPKEHHVRVYEGIGSTSSWAPVRWLGRQLGVAHVDLTTQPNTQIRMMVESEQGRVTNQTGVRPGGAKNPTAGRPSGLTFNPPVLLRVDGSADGKSWLDPLQSANIEIKGLDIVPVEGQPGRLKFKPVLGNTSNFEGNIMALVGGDQAFADMVGEQLVKTVIDTETMPQNTAQLAQAIYGFVQAQTGKKRSADSPLGSTGAKELIAATESNLRFAARGTLRSDVAVRVGEHDQLTLRGGNRLTLTNARGGLDVVGDVALGPTRIGNGQAQLAMASARAHVAISSRDGAATIALSNLNADNLSVSASYPSGRIKVSNGSLRQGDVSISARGTDVSYSGSLNGLAASEIELTQRSGAYVRVQGAGNGGLARLDRLEFKPTGAIAIRNMSGRISANGELGHSRFYVERADLARGSFDLSPQGALTTSPLHLTNMRMAVTDLNVPPGGAKPGAIAAHVRWLDARAPEATLTVNPKDGYTLRTPANRPADIVVSSDAATFRLPSPQAVVHVSDAHASGKLNLLQIAPGQDRERIEISDWYMTGKARGSIVAGPPGSQASRVAITPGSNVSLFVDQLGFDHGSSTQRVSATAQVLIDGAFDLPPANKDAQVRAGGRAEGTFFANVSTSGDEVRARTRARIARIRVEADVRADAGDVTGRVRKAVEDVRTKLRESTPPPRGR